MPSTPSTPATPHRRRAAGIRRPRVAGQPPAAARPAPAEHEDVVREDLQQDRTVRDAGPASGTGVAPSGRVGLLKRPVAEPEAAEQENENAQNENAQNENAQNENAQNENAQHGDAGGETPDPIDGATRPTGKRRLGSRLRRPQVKGGRARRPVPTLVLVGLLVVLTAAAVFFGIAGTALRSTPAAQNTALVDVGATAQATQQLGDAVKTVYSYDFARLDQNEAAARAVILPSFQAQYDQLFGQVRKLAPQQQAVVTATIATSAVREIDGDRAVVVVFLDQQVTRAQAGNQPQQLAAAGRLTVTGQLVDGTWKIADVQAD